MNFEKIAEYAGGTLHRLGEEGKAEGEIHWKVAEYEWKPVSPKGGNYYETITIPIYEYAEGYFMAEPSHTVQTPRQAAPYVSMHPQQTREDALYDAISGYKMFMGLTGETLWDSDDAKQ